MAKNKLEEYLQFKNSGNLEKIDPALKKKLQDTFEPQLPSKLDSFARGAGQVFTLGFQDELVPYAQKAMTGLSNLISDTPIQQQSVQEIRDEQRKKVKLAKEANPKSFIAGGVAAGIPQAIALPLSASSNLARLGTTAALSGTYGLGESEEETLSGKAKDVVKSGGIGVGIDLALMGTGLGALRGLKTGVGQKIAKALPKTTKVVETVAEAIGPVQTGKAAKNVAQETFDPVARKAQIESESITDFIESNGGFSKKTLEKAVAEGYPIPSNKIVDLKRLSVLDEEIKNKGMPGILRKSASTPEETKVLLEQKFGIRPTPTTTPTLEGVEGMVSSHAKKLQDTYASKIDMESFKVPQPGLPTGQITRDKIAGLNLRNVPANDEDVVSLVQQAAQSNPNIIKGTYEPMSKQELVDLAQQYGLDEKRLLRSWEQGKAWNRQEMAVLGDYLKEQGNVIQRLNNKVDLSDPSQKKAFVQGWMDYFADLSVFTGGKSEAGAALRFARNSKDKSGLSSKDLVNIQKLLSDPKKAKYFQEFVSELPDGDIASVNAFAKQFSKPFWQQKSDQAFTVFVNGLLSGPPTHFKNFLSNAFEVAGRIPTTYGQAGVSAVKGALGKEKTTFAMEPVYQMKGFVSNFNPALKNMIKAWQSRQSQFGGVGKYGTEVGSKRISPFLSKKMRNFIDAPGRALQASDEFFKTLNFGMSRYQEAYNKAVKEGGDVAAKTLEYIQNPTEDILKKAYDDALYYTYTNPLKTSKNLTAIIQKSPLRFVQPFTTTPINVLSRNFEKTPLGFVSLALRGKQLESKRLEENIVKATLGTLGTVGLAGKGISKFKKSQQEKEDYEFNPKEVAMASSVLSGVAGLYADGAITGDGPKDPEERRLWLANHQPRSFMFRMKDGSKKWISYAGIEPFNTVMGTTANVLDSFNTLNKKDAALSVSAGLAKQILNISFMQGLSGLFDAYSDPDRYLQKFVANLAFGMVPYSSAIRNVANATDPTLRKAKTVSERIQSQLPVVKTRLPAEVDIFGNPVTFEGSPATKMFTSIKTKTYNESPAMKEIERLRYSPKSVIENLSSYDKLTPETLFLLKKTKGKLFEQFVTNRLNYSGGDLKKMPPQIALDTLEKIDSKASEIARKRVLVSAIHPNVKKVVEAIIIQNQLGNYDLVDKLNERLDFLLSKNIVELTPQGERAVKRK